MYVSSISPLPKTKPKFPFRYIVALSKDSLLTSLTNSKVIWNVGIFLEKTKETKSKQVKQTGQLAGLNEHDAVVCSLLLRRRRGRRKRKKKVVRSNVKFDVIFPEKDWQSKVRHPLTEECPGRGKKRPFKKNWSQFLSECRRKFLRHNCLNLKFRCKSLFRLIYSSTSTMQRV